MKLIHRTRSEPEAQQMRMLLEKKGIPVFVSNADSGRIFGSTLPGLVSLWVYLDDHLADAEALIADPEHEVAAPLDIEAFYDDLESGAGQQERYRQTNRLLLWLAAAGLGLGLLLYLIASLGG